jgi:hypothetical protein
MLGAVAGRRGARTVTGRRPLFALEPFTPPCLIACARSCLVFFAPIAVVASWSPVSIAPLE